MKFINLILSFLIAFSPAYGLEVNGQLKNALLEKLAADPANLEAQVYYNTTSKKPKIYNGVAWSDLGGSSGGSGEKNYISANPSAATDTTGWTCVGNLAVARTTTAGDLPRPITTASGLKITADSGDQLAGDDYCYFDFTLDTVDLNRKLNIKWAQKQTGTYVASNLAVVITTQADRTTAVATPLITNIAAYNGEFNANGFDTASTTTLSLVIRSNADMTTNGGIVISDVIVGPGSIQTVPAIGNWETYTPTVATISGYTTSPSGRWRRVGDTMELYVYWRKNGSAGTGGTSVTISLPTGYTLDVAKTSNVTSASHLGHALVLDTVYNSLRTILFDSSTTLSIGLSGGTMIGTSFAANSYFEMRATVPIAEWAGAPNYAGQNDVEYAYNTSAWDTDDETSFAYGLDGQTITASTNLATTRTKRVRFQTAIQSTDVLILQFKVNEVWRNAPDIYLRDTGYAIEGLHFGTAATAAEEVGAGIQTITSSTTDVYVRFGHYSSIYNNATKIGYATSIGASVIKWRVKKERAGVAVGFGLATATQSGLVKSYEEATHLTTFTFISGTPSSASGNSTVRIVRIGNLVTITGTAVSVTSGTNNAIFRSNTAIPVFARPGSFIATSAVIQQGGAALTPLGMLIIGSNGIIDLYRDGNATTFATAAANAGFNQNWSITYVIN